MMAVTLAAVARMTAVALTSGGDCGGHSVGEVKSSKEGMVLHLQVLGSSVGHGAVNKPLRESAGEREGVICCPCCRFNSRDCGLSSPLSTFVKPDVKEDDDDNDNNNKVKGLVSRGGEI
jgi:hypothetical protein